MISRLFTFTTSIYILNEICHFQEEIFVLKKKTWMWYHHKQLNNHVCRSRTDWRHNDDKGDDNDDDVDDDGDDDDYDDGDDGDDDEDDDGGDDDDDEDDDGGDIYIMMKCVSVTFLLIFPSPCQADDI